VALGNDIVDLNDPFAREKGRCRRYASRVLSFRELVWWEESRDPSRLLWTCWSAKEAAYKAFRKIAGPVPFLPKRIEMTEDPGEREPELRGTVDTPWGKALFRLLRESTHVHALCAPAEENILDRARWHIDGMTPMSSGEKEEVAADPSRAVRRAAVKVLAPILGVREEDIRIIRNHGGAVTSVPILLVGNKELPVDLSLSHDGRYVAVAFMSHSK